MRRTAVPLVLGGLLLAGRELPFVRSDAVPSGRPAEDEILEAVFRQQIAELLDVEARSRGTVVCLAIDPGDAPQSVSRDFLARFRDEPSVRRAAECEARPEGAVALAPLRPAVIVTAGPVEWVAADEAWVAVVRFRSRDDARSGQYRVVRGPSGWTCLGEIIRMAPA